MSPQACLYSELGISLEYDVEVGAATKQDSVLYSGID